MVGSLRGALVIVVAVVVGAVFAPVAGAADPVDAFYRTPLPPKKLPGKRHGDLIRQKRLTGPAAVAGAAETKLVIYRSTDAAGDAVPVSGVVSIPKGRMPKGGWPVITFAHGTTGSADVCAPSHDAAGSSLHPVVSYIYPLLTRWLRAGYAVVRTDYQGLGTAYDHQYLIGATAGHSVLDMVRAARQAVPRTLSDDIVIAGHSQGGHAALFAAAEAPRYTPDLHVRGTVAFAPASHLEDQIPLVTSLTQPNPGLTALVAMIAGGLQAAYGASSGGFDLATLLTPNGISLAGMTQADCLPQLAADATRLGLTPATLFQPGADLTRVRQLLGANDPSRLKITTPLLIAQGDADTTVIPAFTDQLATELKANGERRLTYTKVPGADHVGVTTGAGATAATTFITKSLPAR